MIKQSTSSSYCVKSIIDSGTEALSRLNAFRRSKSLGVMKGANLSTTMSTAVFEGAQIKILVCWSDPTARIVCRIDSTSVTVLPVPFNTCLGE